MQPRNLAILKTLRLNQSYRVAPASSQLHWLPAWDAATASSASTEASRKLSSSAWCAVLEPRLTDTKDFADEEGSPGSRDAVVRPHLGGLSRELRAHLYTTDVEDTEYLALVLGDIHPDEPVLVRVQTACFPGDVFGSASCDCGAQLRAAMQAIEREGRGVFLYVYAAGRQSLPGLYQWRWVPIPVVRFVVRPRSAAWLA